MKGLLDGTILTPFFLDDIRTLRASFLLELLICVIRGGFNVETAENGGLRTIHTSSSVEKETHRLTFSQKNLVKYVNFNY